MNLYGQPKNSTAFKFVALLNIASFMVFRMAVSLYLLFWQITNALSMEWYLTIVGPLRNLLNLNSENSHFSIGMLRFVGFSLIHLQSIFANTLLIYTSVAYLISTMTLRYLLLYNYCAIKQEFQITFVVIVSLSITNTVLLYRVLAADGLLGTCSTIVKSYLSVSLLILGTNRQRNSTIPSAQSSQPADETEDDLNFEEHDESTSDDDGTDIENGARSKSYKGVHNSVRIMISF